MSFSPSLDIENLQNRVAILEALVKRLLSERGFVPPSPPLGQQPQAPFVSAVGAEVKVEPGSAAGAPPPPPVSPNEYGDYAAPNPGVPPFPYPHPDWLPVYHKNGPGACGGVAICLTRRVSGVHTASREPVRILPRVSTGHTALPYMTEPWREPRADDHVLCATCGMPIDIWSSTDLDYRPWLDNEIGQPMYPREARQMQESRVGSGNGVEGAAPPSAHTPVSSTAPFPDPAPDPVRVTEDEMWQREVGRRFQQSEQLHREEGVRDRLPELGSNPYS